MSSTLTALIPVHFIPFQYKITTITALLNTAMTDFFAIYRNNHNCSTLSIFPCPLFLQKIVNGHPLMDEARSVYSFNIYNSSGNVKTWTPSKDLCHDNLSIVDVCGHNAWQLILTEDGRVYSQGNIPWMEFSSPTALTIVSRDVPGSKVIGMSASTELFALLYSDGSVYASGGSFWKTLSQTQLCKPGFGKEIAVTKQSIMVSTGHSLLLFTSPTSSTCLDLGTASVVCLASYEPGYLVLLDDGILYCTFPVRHLSVRVESSVKSLFIVSGFLGPPMLYMETSLDEIICVYRGGAMVYGLADQDKEAPYPALAALPVFKEPFGGELVHLHISRDLIWFLTSQNHIFYISKLPWLDPDNGKIARFKQAPWTFAGSVNHFRATWNVIYFFTVPHGAPPRHGPLVRDFVTDNLVHRTMPFTIYSEGIGYVMADPLGVSHLGLRPGDRINSPTRGDFTIIGSSGKSLIIDSESSGTDTLKIPRSEEVLFKWTLRERPNGDLIDVKMLPGDTIVQIDRSVDGLMRICHFKADDVIESDQGVQAVVLGERCECLWLRLSDRVVMCQRSSCMALHRHWRLKKRENAKMVELPDVDGGTIAAERVARGLFVPPAIVASPEFGIGTFVGIASSRYVVGFVRDAGRYRLIDKAQPLKVLRSQTTYIMNALCLNATYLSLNLGSRDKRLMPCDVLQIEGEIAFHVGTSDDIPYFETEIMIANHLGVGVFEAKAARKIVCEIGDVSRAKLQMPSSTGAIVDLNVNLAEFKTFPVLPLDAVVVGDVIGEICGFCDSTLYIQFPGKKYVEPFDPNCDFDLIYRRVQVPTSKTFITKRGDSVTGWIDLEHFRGKRCLPYDVVDYQGKQMIIHAVVDERVFVVADWETLEYQTFKVPIGKTIRAKYSLLPKKA
jgi:hypothetical protein